ncbi:MAG TPA: adenylate/guanylate cyclase domain-containing protein [Rhodanobacteraceae bacterium]|nr:adenylate/guanylate cyclase domain-containing protein [Rhodanobacteraceae bacterium]
MSTQPPPILYASAPHADVAYCVMGEGPLDVMFVNPMSRSIGMLLDYPPNVALLERLARSSRLIMFDRRGSGISDPLPADLPPTWEDWLEDILLVLDDLGVAKVVLVAERDAASASLLFASSHPERVRALVLGNTSARFRVAPGYPSGERHERAEQLSAMWEQYWGSERMVASTRPTLAGDPEYVRWVTRMQRAAYSPRRAGAEFRYIINFDARAVLSSIRTPTLILHRRDFAVVPVAHGRYLAEHIAGARFELLPGSDMDVLLPGDNQALDLIEEFLAGAQPADGGERALATVVCMRVAHQDQTGAGTEIPRWRELFDQLRTIVQAEWSRFQGCGSEIENEGFLVRFDGPARALRFAASIRQALRDQLRLEIRAGLHIGECERVGDTLAGAAVDVATGVQHAAQAGEVVATAAVRDLVAGSGIELRGIGTLPLEGLSGAWELYALEG